ncbi:MAG: DHH family phosphoesterase [Solobacterium sp.]|nr:DHH family phosphoesterase [Solobacterium sp.]
MNLKIQTMKRRMIAVMLIEAAVLIFVQAMLKAQILSGALILVIQAILFVLAFGEFEKQAEEQSRGVRNILGDSAEEAMLAGELGMVIYDDSYVITWMSELFGKRGINKIGRKILTWIPEADDLISGRSDAVTVQIDDYVFELRRKENLPLLYFRDITRQVNAERRYSEERLVIGMACFDNYEESTQFEDESEVANINNAVRAPLTDYCKTHGIMLKRLSSARYLLILSEKVFSALIADHFSVLGRVRKAAQKMDVSITLSMAFARGSGKLEELDEMVAKLMDLAQTRGGDQVAVQTVGEEVRYFGGSSEAAEKRSRVRVRVMSHSLRDLIQKSSNVIICGHKNADFDCMGSAICLAQMCKALNKQSAIIAKTGGIEEKLKAAMDEYAEELKQEVSFVTESEALNQLQSNTLVIMTDHHNIRQSNGAKVLENAKKVVVIDHHRRATDMGVKPVLIYIEAGASSTCELLAEMLPYVSGRVDLSEIDATFMITGMIVDTARWRYRTGSRTYDAASALRKMGADIQKANEFLKDSYDEFEIKTAVTAQSEKYDHGVIIAPVKDRVITRSLMSQVADSLLNIQDVQAAFVIANTGDNETAISARSTRDVNVQVIMEHMNGGGHMTAAAMQRSKCSIDDLKQELLQTIEQYFREEKTDESDS